MSLSRSARSIVVIILAMIFCMHTWPARSAEVKVIVANAVKGAYAGIAADFARSSGHSVVTTYSGTEAAFRRVSNGEVFDLVLIGSDGIDRLIQAGKLQQGSRVDIARTGIAIAVRLGLPKPDISSGEAIKAAVLNATSIAYSAGPSGTYVKEMLKGLGVSEQIAKKVVEPSSGVEVVHLVARGEVDLGFAQVSEFIDIKDVQNLGPLPQNLQNVTIYAVGVHAASPSPAAMDLIRSLTAPASAPIFRAIGMDPG